MKLKTFFAPNVPHAIEEIRVDVEKRLSNLNDVLTLINEGNGLSDIKCSTDNITSALSEINAVKDTLLNISGSVNEMITMESRPVPWWRSEEEKP